MAKLDGFPASQPEAKRREAQRLQAKCLSYAAEVVFKRLGDVEAARQLWDKYAAACAPGDAVQPFPWEVDARFQ